MICPQQEGTHLRQHEDADWDESDLAGEDKERRGGQGAVERGEGEEGHHQEHPVQGVPPLGPLVKVHARLQKAGGAEEDAPQLDEAPVPPQRFVREEAPGEPLVQDVLQEVPEAVDEDPAADDDRLEDELRPGLDEPLDGAEVVRLLQPPGLAVGPDEPADEGLRILLLLVTSES